MIWDTAVDKSVDEREDRNDGACELAEFDE